MTEVTFGPCFPLTRADGPGINIDMTRGTGYCTCDDAACPSMVHLRAMSAATSAAREEQGE